VAETVSPLRRMGPAPATATGGGSTPLLSPWKTPHSLCKQWALRSHRRPLGPLQFPLGGSFEARGREQEATEAEGWRPTTTSSRLQGWSFDTTASQREAEEQWTVKFIITVKGQCGQPSSVPNSDDNNNDDDNNDNKDQRPIQILQPAAELPWFEGTRKVDFLAFVHRMDKIALVAQWSDDTMGAHSG